MAPQIAQIRQSERAQATSENQALLVAKDAEIAQRDKTIKQAEASMQKVEKSLGQLSAEKVGFEVRLSEARIQGAAEAQQKLAKQTQQRIVRAVESARAQAELELRLQHDAQMQDNAAIIETLKAERQSLQSAAAATSRERAEFERVTAAQAAAQSAEQIRALHAELADQAAQRQVTRDELAKVKDANAAMRLEKAAMRAEIDDEIRDRAEKMALTTVQKAVVREQQKQKAKIVDLEGKLATTMNELDKAHQTAAAFGSRPQPEGIIRQELFAEELKRRYCEDDVRVVPRGQRGADVVQTVREHGRDCGVIVWECKWTKTFNKSWLRKLASDGRAAGAKFAILVTEAMPQGIEGSGYLDGTPVCDFELAPHLAGSFRMMVIAARRIELANVARSGRAEARMYSYVTSDEFMNCLEIIMKRANKFSGDLAAFRNQVNRLYANVEDANRDIIDAVFTIAGHIESGGAKLSAPLRGELTAMEPMALPAGDDVATLAA
ncbi:DUF2130 domain-containing protein [Nocardia sp. NPDC058480]|uniref:DUF2130 domain-containing protein n=1 Tax=Nocardia sp. NPDC058480 TaxID=3346522 RepID=UPI003666617F